MARNSSDLKRSKATYFHYICSSKIHPSQLWKHLNNVLSRKQRSSVKSLIVDGIELMDKAKIAEAINSQFISAAVSSHTSQKLDLNTNSCTSFIFSPVLEEEVFEIISSLDPNKSPGPSNITTKSLQLAISSISPSLTRILNPSLQSGSVHSCWKAANVTPVFKKGDKQDFRTQTITDQFLSSRPYIGKILERVVYTRLLDHLSVHNILTPFQSGFRPNHSTEDVLLRTVEDWRFDVDRGKAVAAVFIDFTKAFDSISHSLLLRKLHTIGVVDTALCWFQDFLSNRRQRVVIDGHSSSRLYVQQGVPQGSLLGPLLFSIYTNDMPSVVTKASINMYADDTELYASHSNAITAAKVVSDDLAKIHNWCFENSLIINSKKTYAMFLSRNKVNILQQRNNATIILDGSPLKTVSEICYLGVHIDQLFPLKIT